MGSKNMLEGEEEGGKSAFELAREERIRQNQAMLAKLGLMGGRGQNNACPHRINLKNTKKKKMKMKRTKSKRTDTSYTTNVPRRKSRRLAKQGAEISLSVAQASDSTPASSKASVSNHRMDFDDKLAEVRELERKNRFNRLVQQHFESGKLPRNATYSHTYMRVRTMSPQALEKRIATIEKAQGTWAVVKMRMFAEILALEGHEELATEARSALERLLELPKYKMFREAGEEEKSGESLIESSNEGRVEDENRADLKHDVSQDLHQGEKEEEPHESSKPSTIAIAAGGVGAAVWLWKSDLEADDNNSASWRPYSRKESKILEKAFKSQRKLTKINRTYSANFSEMIQFQTENDFRRRPIKREVQGSNNKAQSFSGTKSSSFPVSAKKPCEPLNVAEVTVGSAKVVKEEILPAKAIVRSPPRKHKSATGVWLWKSDLEKEDDNPNAWTEYSDKDTKILEKAFQSKRNKTKLNRKYSADFSEMIQFQTRNRFRQRSIKRLEKWDNLESKADDGGDVKENSTPISTVPSTKKGNVEIDVNVKSEKTPSKKMFAKSEFKEEELKSTFVNEANKMPCPPKSGDKHSVSLEAGEGGSKFKAPLKMEYEAIPPALEMPKETPAKNRTSPLSQDLTRQGQAKVPSLEEMDAMNQEKERRAEQAFTPSYAFSDDV